jgi:dipeptidyl aminopeptidase/acylaminoacyl peptidase
MHLSTAVWSPDRLAESGSDRRFRDNGGMEPLAERFLTVSRAAHPVPLATGGLAFSYDLAGHPQVFRVEAPGGWPIRVGAGSHRTLPIAETPRGLLVRQDQGGNEAWQVGLAGPEGLRLLTHDSKAMHIGVVLGPDGRRAGLARNPNGQVDMVLGVLDLETGTIEDWADPGGLWQWQGWHPDGTVGLAEKVLGSNRVETYLVRRGEPPTQLLPGTHMVAGAAFTGGGRLFALTDHDADFAGLAELDPERPESPPRWVVKSDRDVDTFQPDPSGRTAAVAVNMGAYDRLLRVDLDSGREQQVYDLPHGTVYADNVSPPETQLRWSPDGESLFVTWNTPVQPAEIFELEGGQPKRWTFAGERLPGAVMPEETSHRTFDGLQIPALHFKAGPDPRPTVVYFHGGPESQARGNFQGFLQMFVAAGISVFVPNVRGSSGYGLRYLSLDDRALRWDSVRDGCEAARHLKREGLATTTAAMGGSYGGFMTLAVLVEDPELWDAACDIVGIADWRTFFKNTSGWRRAARIMEYGDPEGAEKEVLAEFSPLARAHVIKAPLLVLHGRNDPRVPVSEAEQIATASGAELIIFEDEGHGLARHANRLRGYGRALAFFKEKLAGREPAGQAAS